MDSILTTKQLDLCIDDANYIAKIILEKDISKYFNEFEGNANYALETTAYLSAGIIACISKILNMNTEKLSDLFIDRVKRIHESEKIVNRKLRIVQ